VRRLVPVTPPLLKRKPLALTIQRDALALRRRAAYIRFVEATLIGVVAILALVLRDFAGVRPQRDNRKVMTPRLGVVD
jgi:hypothetical protein